MLENAGIGDLFSPSAGRRKAKMFSILGIRLDLQ